ncbi:MAG: tyrosine-type recombinase/integrase, partial [Bacilli bacterium]|nr:tyrosine-type recombinase/integrase [Bacilli bacterium]
KKKACEKAHIHEITQHEFRHSYATRMIHKGVSIDYVSRSMGHSKVSMTCDVYLHQEKRIRKRIPFIKKFF